MNIKPISRLDKRLCCVSGWVLVTVALWVSLCLFTPSPDFSWLSSLKLPEVYTPVLEHLIVAQIDTFPQYSPKMQSVCCKAIVKVFLALAEKGPVLWNCIGTVGEFGIHSCFYDDDDEYLTCCLI